MNSHLILLQANHSINATMPMKVEEEIFLMAAIYKQLDLQLVHRPIRKDRTMASAFHERFLLEDCRQILMKVSFFLKNIQ